MYLNILILSFRLELWILPYSHVFSYAFMKVLSLTSKFVCIEMIFLYLWKAEFKIYFICIESCPSSICE